MNEKRIGAVLIAGGGIGGIQASLDLADSGFKVYLVDKNPSIGGVMAQLDKTFPTNDCSMCILAPKLVATGRHPNIEVITNSEIEGISGEPGNFTIKVKKHPRYIDLSKCTGCGDCADACPVEVDDEFQEGLAKRKAIYRLYPQAVPAAFMIEKRGVSPCRDACPAKLSGQGYIALINQGKYREAIAMVRKTLPFPSICGRVCHHPCEDACNRKDVDEPLSIRALKRFIADWAREQKEDLPEPIKPTKKEKIAIVGAGPAGLTCARLLFEEGYPVTVFDESEYPGGMMTSCLPEYRLPREIADYDINRIAALGIDFRMKTRIGKDISLSELEKEYEAIFLAIGAQNAKKLRIQGLDAEGVFYGIPFLKTVKQGKKVRIGRRIIVIGGGNVAIDCARSALRLGAKEVTLVCLETDDLTSKDRMPAHDWEIEEAREEGITICASRGPKRILTKNGRVRGLETIECTSVYEGEERLFKPVLKERTESTIEGDTVIVAIGQEIDFTGFTVSGRDGLKMTPWKTIETDPISLQTSDTCIFAGGDAVLGPSSVIEAVAQGREAAISIDRYIQGLDIKEGREPTEIPVAELPEEVVEHMPRNELPRRAPEARIKDFLEVESGFTEEVARKEAERCLDCGICSECLQCVETCKAEAICHDDVEEIAELNVGAVILALGYDMFDAKLKSEYGYGRYKNVVTSIEFERMLSASGPFGGHLVRLSDDKEPRQIAFIQCVGSRDPECGNDYCSSVCCTYAIKEAIIAKEHSENGLETAIFYMDMRTHGKGFDSYYERARDEYGVRFVRAGVPKISELPDTHNLLVRYEDEEGELRDEEFDLVVLSVGFESKSGIEDLSQKLGIELDRYGFCRTNALSPLKTMKDGVYVCGAFSGPKDIPETVVQASGTACEAMSLLENARDSLTIKKTYPPEIDVTDQPPRIGVFVCHCGINIGGYVNVPEVTEYVESLPDVAYAENNLYTCSQDTQKRITEMIKEHSLNRVVVASCTPRTHEPLFQETIREAGLNPHLFEMANIRDQCSWIHMQEPEKATQKAKDLVRMAVAKARLIHPLRAPQTPVIPKGLVIGGGVSGMVAALGLARQGFETFIIEREKELGGHARNIYYDINGNDVQEYVKSIIREVDSHPLIHVYLSARIKAVDGFIGNYKTTLETRVNPRKSRVSKIEHGVIIVATGAEEYRPSEYLYGKHPHVITQQEFEERLGRGQSGDIRSVVMIQCVGSRDNEHPYCSRVCCTQAVKNALKMLELNPQANVYILYRDVRTYGMREIFYRKARDRGVTFIRFDEHQKPELIVQDGFLKVSLLEPILREQLIMDADLLVLSTGIRPAQGNESLAKYLKVPLGSDNFFLEAHVKLRPVDFATEGVFLAGMAHGPKTIDESIAQAFAAAGRASTILSKTEYVGGATIATVDGEVCAGCGICVSLCPYEALEITTEKGKRICKVKEALCKGCGSCSAACPSGASQQLGFNQEQLHAMVEAALESLYE